MHDQEQGFLESAVLREDKINLHQAVLQVEAKPKEGQSLAQVWACSAWLLF